ncbi:hypothetical protein Aperf_G00000016895 [Anoplocephala perfoliata]
MGRQIQVAVKVLDLDRFPTKMDDFLKEAAIMNELDHPDIVRLYGICVAPKCLRLVTELAPLRSLLECLREPDLRTSFPVSTLHSFAIQIARGMAYLEEERLVHRDLAARNVLVFAKDRYLCSFLSRSSRLRLLFEARFSSLLVKIGDFGLSRALQLGKSHYQTNFNANLRLPIAWCALEAIHELRFTSASDVWSYGVTLWEMFTYGFVPWAGLSGRQILEAVDVPNCQRLPQPDACPDAVFDAVIRACWNHEPTSRPTFAQLTDINRRRNVKLNESSQAEVAAEMKTLLSPLISFAFAPSLFLPRLLDVPDTSQPAWCDDFAGFGLAEMLPHLSPQAWSVVEDSGQLLESKTAVPRTVDDIRSLLTENRNGSTQDAPNANAECVNKALLRARVGEIVYVLSKKDPELWKVVSHSSCQVGYIPPENLRIIPTEGSDLRPTGTGQHQNSSIHHGGTLSRMRLRFSRRESNRNSPKGGKKFNRDLISLPQNDFRHVGHVGADGTIFGDVGFSLDNVDEDDRVPGLSPTDSCMTIESASDKENPRLSDTTIAECSSQRSSVGSKAIASSRTTVPSTDNNNAVLAPLSSPLEKNRLASSTVPSNPPAPPPPLPTDSNMDANSWFTSTSAAAARTEESESSVLDMGSSFMDEIFQCLSAKTDGLNLLEPIPSSTTTTAKTDHSTRTIESAVDSQTLPESQPLPDMPKIDSRLSSPQPLTMPKPARSREVTPTEDSNGHVSNDTDSTKHFGIDQTNGDVASAHLIVLCRGAAHDQGEVPLLPVTRFWLCNPASLSLLAISDRYQRSSSVGVKSNTVDSRTTSIDNPRRGRVGSGSSTSNNGGGSRAGGIAFVNASSTLTRAFRKSSNSLSRRPPATDKAPSALSLEHPSSHQISTGQMPLIRGRLEAGGGKYRRPVISGPVMISNPTLVTGASVTSVLSEGTSTGAVSTPPSSSSPSLRGTSRDSSITAISSPLSLGQGLGTPGGPITPTTTSTTTPSISPAPSNSSLTTSSTSSSNLVLHHQPGGRVYGNNNATGIVSGVGGLRALRDRGDLVFRAPAAVGAVGGGTRRTRANHMTSGGGEYQPRFVGITTGGTLDRRIRPQLPVCPATVTLPRRANHFGPFHPLGPTLGDNAVLPEMAALNKNTISTLQDRNSVDATEVNGKPARLSSYSTRDRVVDQETGSISCQSSSVVTPTAQGYSFTAPPTESQKAPPLAFEADTSAEPTVSPSGGLSEELLSFWGSEFASLLDGNASAAS